MTTAGIDVGMRLVKVCLVSGKKIIASRSFDMDALFMNRCREALAGCVVDAGTTSTPSRIEKIAATGYGAALVRRARIRASEGACIAAALRETSFRASSVVDAGGLFIKIHRIDAHGMAADTLSNEKCAAGSGRFLEIVAQALKLPFPEVAAMDLSDAEPFNITSSCAVFAESEVISQIGRGTPARDILAGVMRSLAVKTATLMDHARADGPVVLTGGLSSVSAYVAMLRKISGREISIIPTGTGLAPAFGAALIGEATRPGLAETLAARLVPRRMLHG